MRTFVLGGGCFWCLDAVYQKTKGVSSVVSGYTGGHDRNPDYYSVCSGTTGHAEVVAVTYEDMGLLPHGKPASWYDPGRFWSGDDLELCDGYRLGAEISVSVTSQ